MRATRKRLFISAILIAIFFALDCHVLVVQGFAWTRMAIHFAQKDKFEVAVHKTFDGRHLCPICRALNSLKAKGPKLNNYEFRKNLETFCSPAPFAALSSEGELETYFVSQSLIFNTQTLEPPTPPPKTS